MSPGQWSTLSCNKIMPLQGAGQQAQAAKAEVRRAPRLADERHAKHTVISTGLYRPVELSIWRQRRVPAIGSHVDPLNGMNLCFIRVRFAMQSSSGTAGHHLTFHRAGCVTVEPLSEFHICLVGGYPFRRPNEPSTDEDLCRKVLACIIKRQVAALFID